MEDGGQTEFAVLDYLVKHPSAQDTLEGIAEWWILRGEIERKVEKIARTLDSLVGKGFVTVRQVEDSASYYELNRERLAEIRCVLRDYPDQQQADV